LQVRFRRAQGLAWIECSLWREPQPLKIISIDLSQADIEAVPLGEQFPHECCRIRFGWRAIRSAVGIVADGKRVEARLGLRESR